MEPRARPGRLVGWFGRGSGCAPAASHHRHRHRRLDPPTGGTDQPHRPQADLRPRVALGHDRLRLQPRPGWPAGPYRRRLRPAAARHGRFRRQGLHQHRRAGAGLQRQPECFAAGPAHRPAEGVLRCRPRPTHRRPGPGQRQGAGKARRRGQGNQPAEHAARHPGLLRDRPR
ncbi:hypothetical protein D3C72_1471510 [compost metagenome]